MVWSARTFFFFTLWLAACAPDTTVVYCTPDETMCHGSCSALYKDPANCGACGLACGFGLVCSKGACATNCGGGTLACGASCVDIEEDHDNCGACGSACRGGLACVDGSCSATCAATQLLCASNAGAYCANVSSDNKNCGTCGAACGTLETCLAAKCVAACKGASQTLCGDSSDTAYCAALGSDPNNCGSCANACSTDGICVAGQCACPEGDVTCGSTCVDVASDPLNCGSCNTICTGTCALGGCAVAIGTATDPGGALTMDATHVFWVESSGAIRQAAKSGSTHASLSATSTGNSVAADGTYVYWPNGSAVDFVLVGGGTLTEVALATNDVASEIVTDAANVYVATQSKIVAFPAGGGALTTILDNEASPHGLATRGGKLYWANADHALRRVDIDGANLVTLTTMSSSIGAVAVDDVNAYFVWNSDVIAIPSDGSGPALVIAAGLTTPSRVASDGTNVYWIDATTISRAPVGGGVATKMQATSDAADIAVDASNLYWTSSSYVMKRTPK